VEEREGAGGDAIRGSGGAVTQYDVLPETELLLPGLEHGLDAKQSQRTEERREGART
jgi:hypothetical protein